MQFSDGGDAGSQTPPLEGTRKSRIISALPLVIVYGTAWINMPAMPFWLPLATARLHTTPGVLGRVHSLEITAVVIATLTASLRPQLMAGRLQIVAVLAIAALAQLYSIIAPTFVLFSGTRLLTGFCYGLLLATMALRAGRRADAAQVFSAQLLVAMVLIASFYMTAGHLPEHFRFPAVFICLAGYCLVSILLVLSPLAPLERITRAKVQDGKTRPKTIWRAYVPLVLIGTVFFTFIMAWSFIGPASARAGLSQGDLGLWLSVGSGINLLGPIISARFAGGRWETPALVFVVLGQGAVLMAFCLSDEPRVMAFCLATLPFWCLVPLPLYLRRCTALDPSGRTVSSNPAFTMTGLALGPAIGGLILDTYGFPPLGIVTGVLMVVVTALTLIERAVPERGLQPLPIGLIANPQAGPAPRHSHSVGVPRILEG